MIGCSFGENRNSLWSRSVSCTALVLYTFALVVVPALHTHGGDCSAAACCEQHSVPHAPDHVDCSICEFAHLVIPFFVASDPLSLETDVVLERLLTVSLPSVVEATILPPCRAPPVL